MQEHPKDSSSTAWRGPRNWRTNGNTACLGHCVCIVFPAGIRVCASASEQSTAQHSTAKNIAAQRSATQHSKKQHSTAQHSTAQHSA
eukprot:9298355-Alexandrium_andersonii.AAC.1